MITPFTTEERKWAARSGDQFDNIMVFDQNPLQDAWSLSDFVDVMRRHELS